MTPLNSLFEISSISRADRLLTSGKAPSNLLFVKLLLRIQRKNEFGVRNPKGTIRIGKSAHVAHRRLINCLSSEKISRLGKYELEPSEKI